MEYRNLMHLVSEVGIRLARSGAETYRVEESVVRILAAYGLESRVYSVPNSLIITVLVPEGLPITQLCRIEQHGNDLDGVEQYNNLSRRICAEKPEPTLALQWLEETEKARKQYPLPMTLLGYILVSCGFCVFFGGSVADCLCAGFCGLMLGLVDHFLGKVRTSVFFQKIIAAFVMAFIAYGLGVLGLADNVDTVVIGTLMLLVPGLLFTNALRDIIFGDTNSGINRIVEVLLIAAAVALGTAAAWNFATAVLGTPGIAAAIDHPPVLTCITSVIACAGFVIVFNIHGYGNMLCALGGGITWAAFCIVSSLGGGELFCCFVATVIAAVYAEIMARVRKYPAISYLVISLLPLIPGAGIYYTAQQAIQSNMDGFIAYGTNTLATAGVMAVGILLVSTVVRMMHHR